MPFQLDTRLQNDCYQLAESEHSVWLLLNNRHFPWFIIVPKTHCTELFQLHESEQAQLQKDSNLLSEFVTENFHCDKLNIACIGNIVKQMHIHIIARAENDPCWPGVVWGTNFKQSYETSEVAIIQKKLDLFLQNRHINNLQLGSSH